MKRHPQPGRPPLPPDRKRSERIVLKVTPAEYRALKRAACDEETPIASLGYRVVMRWLKRRGID